MSPIGPVIEERHGNGIGQPLTGPGERWRLRAEEVEGYRVDLWLGAHADVEVVDVKYAAVAERLLGGASNVYCYALILYREKEKADQ